MSTRKSLILVAVLIVLAKNAKGVKRVTVDAGDMTVNKLVTLYAGGDYLVLDHLGMEEETGRILDIGPPEDFRFIASAETLIEGKVYIYGPDFYYTYYRKIEKHNYSPAAAAFFDHSGPDAVAQCNDEMFFFKGCKVAKQEKWSSAVDVRAYGLPCSPDAAWKTINGDGMMVLKGDQIWLWDCKGRKTIKVPFSSMYHMTSWELIPKPE